VEETIMKYITITPEAKKEFWQMITDAPSVLITSHYMPDDDSIGSVLGLYHSVLQKYPDKKVRIMYTGGADSRYSIFPGFEKIEHVEDASEMANDAGLLIILDTSRFDRVSRIEGWKASVPTVCIDHHKTPPSEFNLSIIDTSVPCCAELVYELCSDIELTKTTAELFLLGILGDTGNFAYMRPDQLKTMDIARRLIEAGNISIQEFQARYRGISARIFAIIQEFIKNMRNDEVAGYKPFSYSFITESFVAEHSFTDLELTNGKSIFVSQYIRSIQGHPWGFTVMPNEKGGVRLSCRSLPQGENVRLILEGMQIGGGHDLAAGGTMHDESDPEKAILRVKQWLRDNPQK
jgi:bifunctional oligoribonuclease and PAP phosphatase NrnA